MSRRALLASAASLASPGAQKKPPVSVGLQIYSLRREAGEDLPGTLALIRRLGFEEVEVPELYGRSAAEFRRLLDDSGLKATSMGADFARLDGDLERIAEEAHQLGALFVVCGTIPHRTYLTAEECLRGAEALNRFGELLSKSGLHCCYHTHGTEFGQDGEGTVFDRLVGLCDPRFVNFEVDIFWIVYARQDPVALLRRYPGRFPLMHVKDIRKGTVLGGLPRDVREEESVPLGTGLVDVAASLKAGLETGVRHYYLEDEAVDAVRQIPESLRFLNRIRW